MLEQLLVLTELPAEGSHLERQPESTVNDEPWTRGA